MNSSIYYNCSIKFKCTLRVYFKRKGGNFEQNFSGGIENEEEKVYSTEGYTHSDDADGSTYIWSRKCLCG